MSNSNDDQLKKQLSPVSVWAYVGFDAIPGLDGVHFGKESYIMLVVWIALGIIFYAMQWKHFKED